MSFCVSCAFLPCFFRVTCCYVFFCEGPTLTGLLLDSFVSRANPKSNDKHVILGVIGWKPRDFANQMNLSLSNGWGIVRTIADMCLSREEDSKFVLVKDPNKSILRLYAVPATSFDEDADDADEVEEPAEAEE